MSWWPLEVSWVQVEKRRGTVMATVLICVCYGGGVRTWAGGFVIWGGLRCLFELFLLQSCVSHPISHHLSACMFFLFIPCRRVWVQTSCCDFECLVFDRNKYLMMMMMMMNYERSVDPAPADALFAAKPRLAGAGGGGVSVLLPSYCVLEVAPAMMAMPSAAGQRPPSPTVYPQPVCDTSAPPFAYSVSPYADTPFLKAGPGPPPPPLPLVRPSGCTQCTK